MMPSNHLILCCLLLLPPSIFHNIMVFSNELILHIRWTSIGFSASASVLPMNIQDWFPLGWTSLISLQSKGLSNTTVQKNQLFIAQISLYSNSHIHTWLLEKPQVRLDGLVGMADHFSTLTLRTPWTVLKGKIDIKIWHMKICSVLLSIREVKIKTAARYQLTAVRIVILRV